MRHAPRPQPTVGARRPKSRRSPNAYTRRIVEANGWSAILLQPVSVRRRTGAFRGGASGAGPGDSPTRGEEIVRRDQIVRDLVSALDESGSPPQPPTGDDPVEGRTLLAENARLRERLDALALDLARREGEARASGWTWQSFSDAWRSSPAAMGACVASRRRRQIAPSDPAARSRTPHSSPLSTRSTS